MASLLQSCGRWLWRQLGWSNSRQSWTERGATVVLLGAVVAAWVYGDRLSGPVRLALVVSLAAFFGLVLRQGWVKLFGPVLGYDLIRTGRRRQMIRMRVSYAVFLLTVYVTVWLGLYLDRDPEGFALFGEMRVEPEAMAALNFSVTCVFLVIQFAMAFLLTPVYVAAAIGEEKQRHTLEFLLATDLRNREIVLSLVIARLANLAMVILTGLPILAMLQFQGGVDPSMLLAGFAATGLTVLSLAGLAVLNSVYARRPLDAIVRTYLIALTYLALTGSAKWFLPLAPTIASFPTTDDWTSPVIVSDVVDWASFGNIVSAVKSLIDGLDRGTALDDLLPDVLREYAWFHAVLALGCTAVAVLRFRTLALRQVEGPRRLRGGHETRPAQLGRWPMLWKEVIAETRGRFGCGARLGAGLLVTASVLPALGMLGFVVYRYVDIGWNEYAEAMHTWVRIVSTSVACLMLLQVTVRASASVSSECERQTLDTLLTTPIDSTQILFAKWLGSVTRPRWSVVWLASLWAMAWLTGGIELSAIGFLAGAWLVYAAFLASLGIWFSVRSRTTSRATLGAIIGLVLATVGHWAIALLYVPVLAWLTGWFEIEDWAMNFHAYGLTPPLTLDLLTYRDDEFPWRGGPTSENHWNAALTAIQLGLACYALGAVWVWLLALRLFRRTIGRAVAPRTRQVSQPTDARVLSAETVP
ncbi:MAG: ABC transporter permease [Gemmataceae bacterium]|nr:ABC transporter permease [Gemmataceae bacterium]